MVSVKIGNSNGVEGNMALGNVSRYHQNPSETNDNAHFLTIEQTALLNPGDSGGPLLSLNNGKVVGVNFAKGYGSIENQAVGLGYTIATPEVQHVLKSWGFLE